MKVDILEQTRKDIFAVPIFELEVDLKFINTKSEFLELKMRKLNPTNPK